MTLSAENPIKFITDLILKVVKDNAFELKEDFYVSIYAEEVVVPEGFHTDLASVPRVPVIYWLVGGRGHKAAVLHDWLYTTLMFDQETCDKLFYYALRASDISHALAWAMYKGVRIGGHTYYNKRLKEFQGSK